MNQQECISALNALSHSSNRADALNQMRIPVEAHLVWWCGGGVVALHQLIIHFLDQAADTELVMHTLKQFERWLGL